MSNPQPSVDKDSKTTEEIIDSLSARMNPWVESRHVSNAKNLASYPEEMLHRLVAVPEEGIAWEFLSNLVMHGDPATALNEGFRFFPHLTTENSAAARSMIKSLHSYPQLPTVDDYSTADQRTQEQCAAILTVCDMLEEAPYYSPDTPTMNFRDWFPDKQQRYQSTDADTVNEKLIVDLLVQHPELAERIGTIIIERQSMDMELIKEIIHHENPALANGIL